VSGFRIVWDFKQILGRFLKTFPSPRGGFLLKLAQFLSFQVFFASEMQNFSIFLFFFCIGNASFFIFCISNAIFFCFWHWDRKNIFYDKTLKFSDSQGGQEGLCFSIFFKVFCPGF